jgi:hypothetical protein
MENAYNVLSSRDEILNMATTLLLKTNIQEIKILEGTAPKGQ